MTETGKTTLRQRARAATTEALLDAAEAALVERGYDKGTMQDLATAAGCATGTFYLYFRNKEEIFEAIVSRHAAKMFGLAREAIGGSDDPLERLRRGTEQLVRYACAHRPFFRMFFTAVPYRHRQMRTRLAGCARSEHEQYELMELEVIREAQQKQRIRGDMTPQVLQGFLGDVGYGVVEEYVLSEREQPTDELMLTLWSLTVEGLGAGGGGVGVGAVGVGSGDEAEGRSDNQKRSAQEAGEEHP